MLRTSVLFMFLQLNVESILEYFPRWIFYILAMLSHKTGCFYSIFPLIFPNRSHSKIFYQSVGKICSYLGFSVFVDLSSYHNLFGSRIIQPTEYTSNCSSLWYFKKNHFFVCATATIFNTQFMGREKSKHTTKCMGLRIHNLLGSTGEARTAFSALGMHAA